MSDGEHYLLRDVKRHDCLTLYRAAMADVGRAAQTLAAVLRLASKTRETFASVRVIADLACLPRRTVQRHLDELVAGGWLMYQSRQRRRTPTYVVPKYIINAKNAKFAVLPRWAASTLGTWAECAVYALVTSRDSLNEKLSNETDVEDVDMFGRLQYPVRMIAQDSGLAERSIDAAKKKLVAAGLLKIDGAMIHTDELGRIKTVADTLMLNPDYEVPASLVDRPAKVAHCRPAKVAHCATDAKALGTLHRPAETAHTPRKNGARDPAKVALDPPQKWRLQLIEPLIQSSKGITNATAEPQADSAGVCFPNAEEEEEEEDEDYKREKFIAKCRENFGVHCPNKIELAVDTALMIGCTIDQLRARARWAFEKRIRWKPEHRAGAIFRGLADCTPGLKEDQGWPSFTQ